MLSRPRQGLAVLAAVAALGATATPASASSSHRLLDDPVAILLALAPLDDAAAAALLAPLPADLVGDVLLLANGAQTDRIVDLLSPTGLDGAVNTLTPAEVNALLADVPAGDLATVFQTLDPAQVTGLLGTSGGPEQVTAGLLAVAAKLAASPADPAAVNALVAQVQAALPVSGANLDPVLAAITPLIANTPGLDAAQLQALLATVSGLPLAGPAVAPLVTVINTVLGVPGGGGNPTPGGGNPNPGGGGTTQPPGGGSTTPPNTRFRATVRKIKVAKNRRSAKITVACPATAPACAVTLTGKAAKRTAFKKKGAALLAGQVKTVKVKLTKAVAKRLAKKGGKLKVTAATAGSSLGAKSKSVRVKRR